MQAINVINEDYINKCQNFLFAQNFDEEYVPSALGKKMIKSFFEQGGQIDILDEGQKIKLEKGRYTVGCSGGINRSQTLRALLIHKGCQVDHVIAGGDTAIHPFNEFPAVSNFSEEEQAQFYRNFKLHKVIQLGTDEKEAGWCQCENLQKVRNWYRDFFKASQPTHYIGFSYTGPSVLMRLLETKKDLKGYKITFIPWEDEILRPPKGMGPCSDAAYLAFYEKLERHFEIA